MPSMMQKHQGAASELAACQFLLDKGYEVFRNVSAHGPADLVAWNPTTHHILLIDVKTSRPKELEDGHHTYNYHCEAARQARALGVKLLLVVPEEGYRCFWNDYVDEITEDVSLFCPASA